MRTGSSCSHVVVRLVVKLASRLLLSLLWAIHGFLFADRYVLNQEYSCRGHGACSFSHANEATVHTRSGTQELVPTKLPPILLG